MEKIEPYPDMKMSNEFWLQEIPKHWKLKRIKVLVENVTDSVLETSSFKRRIALEHVESWTGKFFCPSPDSVALKSGKAFCPDDVLFAKLRPYLAKVVLPQEFGFCSGEFLVLRVRNQELLPNYLEHLLRSKPVIDLINSFSVGAKMPRIEWPVLGNIVQPLPPVPEQETIVRYLDYVGSRVWQLIDEQRNFIDLLQENKQAIISHVMRRGLNSVVSLKNHEHRFLGAVPEHWDIVRLGQIGHFLKGKGGNKNDNAPDGIPCVRYGDLYLYYQFVIEQAETFVQNKSDYTPIYYGDVLFAASGETIEEIGKSAVNLMSEDACCGGDVILFRPSIEIDPHFFAYALNCPQVVYQKSRMGRGITIIHIYAEQLRRLFVALPPLEEQKFIANYLNEVVSNIDNSIVETIRSIELIKEYYIRLAGDVVTGKIDVRKKLSYVQKFDEI